MVRVPRLEREFSGTGDLTTALVLAWHHAHPTDFAQAVAKVVATLQAVIARTDAHARALEAAAASADQPDDPARPERVAELRLVQSKADIESPSVVHQPQFLPFHA